MNHVFDVETLPKAGAWGVAFREKFPIDSEGEEAWYASFEAYGSPLHTSDGTCKDDRDKKNPFPRFYYAESDNEGGLKVAVTNFRFGLEGRISYSEMKRCNSSRSRTQEEFYELIKTAFEQFDYTGRQGDQSFKFVFDRKTSESCNLVLKKELDEGVYFPVLNVKIFKKQEASAGVTDSTGESSACYSNAVPTGHSLMLLLMSEVTTLRAANASLAFEIRDVRVENENCTASIESANKKLKRQETGLFTSFAEILNRKKRTIKQLRESLSGRDQCISESQQSCESSQRRLQTNSSDGGNEGTKSLYGGRQFEFSGGMTTETVTSTDLIHRGSSSQLSNDSFSGSSSPSFVARRGRKRNRLQRSLY
eukprot:Nk52_evm59s223 gene=Nk52_evmTU59s223